MSDVELEKLKAKRLAEMKKNVSYKIKQNNSDSLTEKESSIIIPRNILIKQLGYRGLEVLKSAEHQFPNETRLVIKKLSDLILTGYIVEYIDGGKLLELFRSIGINIRIKTKINIEKNGKIVSLSEKLKH